MSWKKASSAGLSEVQRQVRSLLDVNRQNITGFRAFGSIFTSLEHVLALVGRDTKEIQIRQEELVFLEPMVILATASNKSLGDVRESELGWSRVC